jgi:hypothetical protein
MKPLILSATAATLALASMTSAAWWGPYAGPYYGPYGYGAPYLAPPSPQQLQDMAERHREAAMAMMDAHRQAMKARLEARDLPPMPEPPELPGELDLPEPPAFGERPALPEMPAFGERPAIPEMPPLPKRPFDLTGPELPSMPSIPAMPLALPEMPGDDEMPAMPALSLSAEERQAELAAYRAAFKQQADERRAAMQAISDQRRAIAEQRRNDWRCARQVLRPMPYADWADDCAPASGQNQNQDQTETNAGDQASEASVGSNEAS